MRAPTIEYRWKPFSVSAEAMAKVERMSETEITAAIRKACSDACKAIGDARRADPEFNEWWEYWWNA